MKFSARRSFFYEVHIEAEGHSEALGKAHNLPEEAWKKWVDCGVDISVRYLPGKDDDPQFTTAPVARAIVALPPEEFRGLSHYVLRSALEECIRELNVLEESHRGPIRAGLDWSRGAD